MSKTAFVRVFCAAMAGLMVMVALIAKQPTSAPADDKRVAELKAIAEKLLPLATTMGKPQEGDWLLSHKEAGQTFDQWLKSDPTLAKGRRRVIYIQPIGEFTAGQRRVVNSAADFLGKFYQLPIKVRDDMEDAIIPDKARRTHPDSGEKQILTSFVLEKILKPLLPDDAACCIAFTATDLWPGEGWNFVFGEASLEDRVSIWSVFRNGDPDKSDDERAICLLRTIKTAGHETGHMFGMHHCTAYDCGMCGCNNRDEADRRPLEFCPECTAKLLAATGADPLKRYQELAAFCRKNDLKKQAEVYDKLIVAIGGKPETQPASAPAK